MTSGYLATVHLGLTNYSSLNPKEGGPVSVFLCRDAWGSPSATQTYLGTVTPTEQSGTTNNSVVRLVVAGKVPVSQGLDYWLVLKPAAAPMADLWNNALPVRPGLVANSQDGGVKWLNFNRTSCRPLGLRLGPGDSLFAWNAEDFITR
jgi:hypothetical protein